LNNLLLKCTFRTKLLCSSKTIYHIFYFPGERALPPPQAPANFVVKVVRGSMGENAIGSIRWPISQKSPYRRKNMADIPYKDRVKAFCSKFCCHGNGGRSGKMQLAAFDGASQKTPYRCKNLLRKPSYSQFCSKFRCHSNGGGSGKMQLAAFDGSFPKTPL